jgi:putative two-component system hydrogenase maturation factor HypX/HoxX
LPLLGRQAVELGLIDVSLDADGEAFVAAVRRRAEALAGEDAFAERVELKRRRRREDEDRKPLAVYRQEELARMELNFYGFDPSYHVARYEFVHRRPLAWTPLHLAVHRRQGADTRPGRVAQ